MEKELFERYLNNKCSREEIDRIICFIKDNSLDEKWKEWACEEWGKKHDTKLTDDQDFDSLLAKIHHKINLSESARIASNRRTTTVFLSYLTKVAAILFLPVLAFLFYTLAKNSPVSEKFSNLVFDSIEIVSPVGSRSEIQLADGTVVFLNYGSKLKYPQKFLGKTRTVVLSGEAYFKVAHNPQKPFLVKTSKMTIAALGTEFNVLAYPDEKVFETTLVNGKVKIGKTEQSGRIHDLKTMAPGQHFTYNHTTGKVSNVQENIEKYISWKDGKMIFKDESIVNIANKLGRWYNVDFVFADKESMEHTYTATFVDESLYQILDLLELATPIEYKILPRKKLPNGTFSKQKVIIKKRNYYN